MGWENLEPLSKMHLTLNSCVTGLLKMLTYFMYAALFRRPVPYS